MKKSEFTEVLDVMLGLVIYDHLNCNTSDDQYCKLMEEPEAWKETLRERTREVAQARQIITEAKDNKQNFCDDCGSSQVSYAKIH